MNLINFHAEVMNFPGAYFPPFKSVCGAKIFTRDLNFYRLVRLEDSTLFYNVIAGEWGEEQDNETLIFT